MNNLRRYRSLLSENTSRDRQNMVPLVSVQTYVDNDNVLRAAVARALLGASSSFVNDCLGLGRECQMATSRGVLYLRHLSSNGKCQLLAITKLSQSRGREALSEL